MGPCDVYVHRNLKWYYIQPGSPLVWFHSKYNQLVIIGLVRRVRLGLLAQWHIGMLTWQHYTENVFQGI